MPERTDPPPRRLRLARAICGPLPPFISQRLREPLYPRSQAYRDSYDFETRSRTGSTFVGNTSDFHSHPFSVHGYFDWRNWAVALTACRPGDTIVEIGANVGTETVGFSDIAGPQGKVFAIEPLPDNLVQLERVLPRFNNQNVRLLPVAVGEATTKVRFSPPTQPSDSGIGHIVTGEEASGTILVDCVTLDSIAPELGDVDAIFIDAEGSEVSILRGGQGLLASYKPLLVLEVSPRLLARAGTSVEELTTEIERLGYEPYEITRWGLSMATRASERRTNWVCLDPSRSAVVTSIRRQIRWCGLLPMAGKINPLARVGAKRATSPDGSW